MSTTSPNSTASHKRLVYSLGTLCVAALLLLLPKAQHALPHAVQSSQAVTHLLEPAALLLPGSRDFWHTEGSRILDTRNHPVRISGMNWSGLETPEAVPGGLESQDFRAILRTVKQNGYNTIRIPFSNEMVESPGVPQHIRFSNAAGPINTDLRNLTSLEILDQIVAYSGKIGLKIILDNHRSNAGSSAQESGLWYTPDFPESAWIDDWTALARRYRNTSTVIGMDLRNEPHNADKGGACWDCGGSNDWHRAASRAGNAILAVNPRLLIFVEGVDTYAGDTSWWGGNLEGVRRSPVSLSLPNRLVYSAHEYGPTEYAQPWFNPTTSPSTLASTWRRRWAYISEAGIAPVWIGEFGTPNTDADVRSSAPGSEGQWFSSLVAFLGSHPNLGWTYWGLNGEDRYGLLDNAYSTQPASHSKAEALATITHDAPARMSEPAVAIAPSLPEANTTFAQPTFTAVSSTSQTEPYAHIRSPQISLPALPRQPRQSGSIAIRPLRPAAPAQTSFNPAISTATEQQAIAASIHQAVSTANQNLAVDPGLAAR